MEVRKIRIPPMYSRSRGDYFHTEAFVSWIKRFLSSAGRLAHVKNEQRSIRNFTRPRNPKGHISERNPPTILQPGF